MKKSRKLRELSRAVRPEILADRLGVSRATLRRWERDGVPARAREKIDRAHARRERALRAAETRRARETRIPEKIALAVPPEELARELGISERTARRYYERGETPAAVLDAAYQLSEGRSAYPLEWDHGRGRSVARETLESVRGTLSEFVEAVRNRERTSVIEEAYAAWREVKDEVRGNLSARAWEDLIEELGEELELEDVGVFSKERFKRS